MTEQGTGRDKVGNGGGGGIMIAEDAAPLNETCLRFSGGMPQSTPVRIQSSTDDGESQSASDGGQLQSALGSSRGWCQLSVLFVMFANESHLIRENSQYYHTKNDNAVAMVVGEWWGFLGLLCIEYLQEAVESQLLVDGSGGIYSLATQILLCS